MYLLKQGTNAYWSGDHWTDTQRLAQRFTADQKTGIRPMLDQLFSGAVRFVKLKPKSAPIGTATDAPAAIPGPSDTF
jgi:hypothetical protein